MTNEDGRPFESLHRYRADWLEMLGVLEGDLRKCPRLESVLDRSWRDRVAKQVVDLQGPESLPDGPFQLLRILGDGLDGGHLIPRLERSLDVLEPMAQAQRVLRHLKETTAKLAGGELNQIRAAIHELLLLGSLVVANRGAADLFPAVGDGASNVEGRLFVDGRPLYVEIKALGYTRHDYLRYDSKAFYHGEKTQYQQIHDAIEDKVARGKQLALVSPDEPTVICLALGFNAFHYRASDLLLQATAGGKPSAVLLSESALNRGPGRLFAPSSATCPLSLAEKEFLEHVAASVGPDGHLSSSTASLGS